MQNRAGQNYIYILTPTLYNTRVTLEITRAQLAILDGSWQERPDTLATFDAGATRGTLCASVEVIGDAPDRDALARQVIAAAQSEYTKSHGSVMLGLAQAVRAVNSFFYQHNLNTPREARCIAGITLVAIRERDAYIAQGGPGLVVHARGTQLARYPVTSPWFVPEELVGDFPTPGAVPIGLRRDYTPDLSYIKLESDDTLILGTRALAHLVSEDELADAVIGKPVDAIIENLEELAGSADLAVIALRTVGEPGPAAEPIGAETPEPRTIRVRAWMDRLRRREPEEKIETPLAPSETSTEPHLAELQTEITEPVLEEQLAIEEETPPPAPTPEELEAIRLREEQRRARNARIKAGILGAGSLATRGLAGIGSRVNTGRIGMWVDRAIAGTFWMLARLIRLIMPGTQAGNRGVAQRQTTAWKLAALIFPVIILIAGGATWYRYQRVQEVRQEAEFKQLLEKTKTTIQVALTQSDKTAARSAAQDALRFADDARKRQPTNTEARSVYLQAQDALDQINGISVLIYVPPFATFPDVKAKPTRIVMHLPDIFVLDRGTSRIYQYKIDEVGSNVAPVNPDGVILKPGMQAGERVAGELIDMMWIDAGRVAVIDRAGAFWQYDLKTWSARVANDGNKWGRVNLAGSFLNNLYLLDPGANQILKYVPVSDAWSASVTYFAPGVTPDLSAAVDIAVDTDVWVLRKDGTVLRFSSGRPVDFALRDLEMPLKDPVAISVPVPGGSIFIADAGNQRIVQFDKNTGKYMRQFKPGAAIRDTFSALKTLAVDEVNKKIFILNGTQALFSNLP